MPSAVKSSRAGITGGPLAWAVCGALFLATVLNYMDRQTLSMAGPLIQHELSLDNSHIGMLFSAFFYTYGLMMAVTGWILDRVSVRWGYAVSVFVWSVAGALTGLTTNFSQLFGCRLLLGVGEAANWPAALRTVARVMPPEKRSLANGIFNSGASVGAVITPPLMVYLSMRLSWRVAFVVIGALGIVWVLVWLALTRRVPALDRESRNAETRDISAGDRAGLLSTWPEIFSSMRFWGLIVASVCGNPCYYFYSTWLPTYLVQQRGMHFGTKLGVVMLLPYLGLGLGSALGGLPVFWLTRRGWTIVGARKTTLAFISILTLPAIVVPHIKVFFTALTIIVIVTIGMGAWIANYISALQDLSPRHVAAVAGLIGCFGAFAGALGMWIVGLISSTHYGFGPVFVALALMPVIASLGVIVPRSPRLVFGGID
jgi:ACS family hexuronate transporter-like MFS transporter